MQWKRFALSVFSIAMSCQIYADTTTHQMPWPSGRNQQMGSGGTMKGAAQMIQQQGVSYLGSKLQNWFSRTDLTYAIQQDNKPVGGIETIQPLFMNDLNTLFWQGRLAYSNTSTTGNIGLGYRYMTADKKWMWGINTFYDENIRFLHKRIGFGGELYTAYLTFRANYYDAISRTQLISGNNERALNGYDASVETPVPYFPWIRFNAEGYHWQGVHLASVNGGSATFRTFPMKSMELDLGYAHDNSKQGQLFLKLDYYFGQPVFIEQSATTSKNGSIVARNLENYRLQKVYRHNDIVVEKTGTSAGAGGVTIARGT